MTLPLTNGPVTGSTADIYTDFAGLTALKKSAHNNDPEALRQVAKQYESVFARIMIKSMREAVGKDPLFGSDEGQTYEEMYDDQLSLELSRGKGLGLADILVRQMQHLTGSASTGPGAEQATQSSPGAPSGTAAMGPQSKAALRLFRDNGASAASEATPTATPASAAAQDNFISDLWPAAQQAGQQLGVDPRNLIAQAALETNWGAHIPGNNLFGMKAGGHWSGAAATAVTREYVQGTPVGTTDQFRAYDSRQQSFQDYVSLLRNSPRYTAALNTGSNTHAFANALQQGGYATDPNYASKIAAIAADIRSRTAGSSEPSLKSASARPINPNAGTL